MDVSTTVEWDWQLWCGCEKAMVNEVPVLLAVTHKGESGNMGCLGSALEHICKGQVASMRWGRSSVGLCVFGCCK